MVYQWAKGSRLKANAQEVGEELEALQGSLTPERIVDEARNDSLELHKCFEWDDEEAAEKYRITQARDVLRFISVVTTVKAEGKESETVVVRAYENVKTKDNDREYVELFSALNDIEYRNQIFGRLKNMINEAMEITETYSYLSNNLFEVKKHLVAASSEIEAIAQ